MTERLPNVLIKVCDERDTLRAQLSEANALLERWRKTVKVSWPELWSDTDDFLNETRWLGAAAIATSAQAEIAAWKAAHGPLGPQTPAEVPVFEQRAKEVEAERLAHERALHQAEVAELRWELGQANADKDFAFRTRDTAIGQLRNAKRLCNQCPDYDGQTFIALRECLASVSREAPEVSGRAQQMGHGAVSGSVGCGRPRAMARTPVSGAKERDE